MILVYGITIYFDMTTMTYDITISFITSQKLEFNLPMVGLLYDNVRFMTSHWFPDIITDFSHNCFMTLEFRICDITIVAYISQFYGIRTDYGIPMIFRTS